MARYRGAEVADKKHFSVLELTDQSAWKQNHGRREKTGCSEAEMVENDLNVLYLQVRRP